MINKRWIYFFIFVLLVISVFELFQLSGIINYFPSTDLSAHVANIHFMNEYGFHKVIPNWYNGYVSFLTYPPGLFFLSIPIYNLINDAQSTLYLLIILTLIIGLVGVYFLGKSLKLSKINSLFLFLFFYFNPVSVAWFYVIGRIPEMLAWGFSFFYIALVYYYKNKKLDKRFFLVSILISSIIIITHPAVFILSSSFLAGLFLIKSFKEKLIIFGSSLISFLLTSFWWVPAMKEKLTYAAYTPFFNINVFRTEFILSFVTVILLSTLLIYSVRKDKKEWLFYSPLLIISFLYVTRLGGYLPIFINIYPRSIGLLLILSSSMIFLTSTYKGIIKKPLIITLQILPILILMIILFRYGNTYYPLYDEKHQQAISLLEEVEDKFIIGGKDRLGIRTKDMYAYAAVKYNLSTPFGWDLMEAWYNQIREDLSEAFNKEDCITINRMINELGGEEILSRDESCDLLKKCGFKEKISVNDFCIYKK